MLLETVHQRWYVYIHKNIIHRIS